MNISILIPHYKSGKITAYAIAQLLKNKGKHEIEIVVIDNSVGDDSIDYLKPFEGQFKYVPYQTDKLQSHGIAFDYSLINGFVSNEWFITIESDSFPINDTWLDYYENIIDKGYDSAGGIMKLSGGTYMHPCGALYNKTTYFECKEYCDGIDYTYFPNLAMKDGFQSHLMVHNSRLNDFLENPQDFIDVASGYVGLTKEQYLQKAYFYSSVNNPFHNGMGKRQESVLTYGQRTPETDAPHIILDNKSKMIYRVGYEPGQFLTYYMKAMGKKIYEIPNNVFWMANRENEQQERTVLENGFTHIWAGSSFLGMKDTPMHDVYEFKKRQIDSLYNSLPFNKKIKPIIGTKQVY